MKLLTLLLLPYGLLSQSTETLDVYFDPGQSTPKTTTYLDFLNKAQTGDISIQLDGYTDTTSSEEFNEKLAEKRISSILSSAKLSDVKTVIHGERDFDSKLGMAGNRRVRITLTITPIPMVPPQPVLEKIAEKPDEKYKEPEMGKRLTTRIKFYNASSKMREYSLPEVDMISMYLRKHPDVRVELHGHVCCTQNTPMSLERAEAVKTALIQRGIASNRITCFGHGNTERLNNEENEQEMDENRRVEVVFLPKN